jgi:hypothetical protein
MMNCKKVIYCMVIYQMISTGLFSQSITGQPANASNRTILSEKYKDIKPSTGPLVTLAANSNYFTDRSGKAIYLVGSHTWSNFQDLFFEGDKRFDYDQYIMFMVENHFNFMRLWNWEHAAWATWTPEKMIIDPMPYLRTGPGRALDGKPKFDLTLFDEVYFERMRARLIKARDNGIYASIMLFQAFSGIWPGSNDQQNNAFRGHYYNKGNNIQNFNGDKDNNNILDLNDLKVREYEAAYIRRIIDYVWDLDNILYEVINEGGNLEWDEFVIKTIKDYEKIKGKQHPVGITGHGCEKLENMVNGPAEWISPGSDDGPGFEDVRNNPPVWDGRKVSVLDTDHIWGHGIDYHWVWRSFLRGHNVLFMDPWDPIPGSFDPNRNVPDLHQYILGRKAMKNTAICARKINLTEMHPSKEISSGGFCLMSPGKEYLIYVTGTETELDMTGINGTFSLEWTHPTEDIVTKGRDIKGGDKVHLYTPFGEDAIAHLKLN